MNWNQKKNSIAIVTFDKLLEIETKRGNKLEQAKTEIFGETHWKWNTLSCENMELDMYLEENWKQNFCESLNKTGIYWNWNNFFKKAFSSPLTN